MQHVEIVMALIKQGDNYLLQLRNGKDQVGALNFIGCFGGKIEVGETPETAICREVAEETTLQPAPEKLEFIGEVTVDSERHGEPITAHARIYQITVPPSIVVQAKEGELVTMTKVVVQANMEQLTPATRACFTELIKE